MLFCFLQFQNPQDEIFVTSNHQYKDDSMVYVALLRGINVGGKNKVDMKVLKEAFEKHGFTSVVTYINSGNIVFVDKRYSQKELCAIIETFIETVFNLHIMVLLKNFTEIRTIYKKLPESWVKNKIMRTDIMFLWDDFDSVDVMEQIPIKAVDNVRYTRGALLWNVLDKDYKQSGISKLLGTKLYKNMTIRNANTFRKIVQIMDNAKIE